MNIGALFEALNKEDIPFVLIGGTALIFYGSKRVTLDTDIAVKTLDLERIVKAAYALDLKAVIGVDGKQYPVFAGSVEDALSFLAQSDWGFLKLLSGELEIDVLYDIPIPFMRLYGESESKRALGAEIKVASLNHLKIMKEKALEVRNDPDKKSIDRIDLDFISKKLGE